MSHYSIFRKLSVYVLLIFCLFPRASIFAHESSHSKIDRLTHEIEDTPNIAKLYLKRGIEYQYQSLWDEALADFKRVIELRPDHKLTSYYRGSLFYASGKYKQAKIELNNYLKNAVDDFKGLVLRARILRKLHEINKSHADYTQAIIVSTQSNASLYIERAELLIEGGEKYFTLALLGLNEGKSRLGFLILFEITAINVNLKQRNYTAALKRIDDVLSKITRKEKWLVRRAEILIQAGCNEEALLAYRNALEAIEKLPEHRAQTPAMILLRQQVIKQTNKLL